MLEELGISAGTAIILLIVLYYVIKNGVKNGMKQAWKDITGGEMAAASIANEQKEVTNYK